MRCSSLSSLSDVILFFDKPTRWYQRNAILCMVLHSCTLVLFVLLLSGPLPFLPWNTSSISHPNVISKKLGKKIDSWFMTAERDGARRSSLKQPRRGDELAREEKSHHRRRLLSIQSCQPNVIPTCNWKTSPWLLRLDTIALHYGELLSVRDSEIA